VLTLPFPVNEVFEATNTGDLPRFVAAFAADGVVDDSGRVFLGHDAIARWSQAESIGVQQTFAATGTRSDGDHTIVTATVGGGGYNGPATFTFILAPDGETIQSMTITG
jgi:hypothetical protein